MWNKGNHLWVQIKTRGLWNNTNGSRQNKKMFTSLTQRFSLKRTLYFSLNESVERCFSNHQWNWMCDDVFYLKVEAAEADRVAVILLSALPLLWRDGQARWNTFHKFLELMHFFGELWLKKDYKAQTTSRFDMISLLCAVVHILVWGPICN